MKRDTPFLILGILFILLAIALRILSEVNFYFFVCLTLGLIFKSIYMIKSIKAGRIKVGLPIYLIYMGVGLLYISLWLRYGLEVLLLANIVLYVAITLKACAVILFLRKKT